MKIERALKLRQALKTRVSDIYSMAILCGMTSTEINEACVKAYADLPASTPQWVRAYIDGFRQALQDSLYADCLVFGGFVDGVFMSAHRNRADYYGKHGIDACAYAEDGAVKSRGHYWREAIAWRGGTYNRGEVKPYFIG